MKCIQIILRCGPLCGEWYKNCIEKKYIYLYVWSLHDLKIVIIINDGKQWSELKIIITRDYLPLSAVCASNVLKRVDNE